LALPTTGSGTVTFTVITPPVTLYGANILNQTMSGVLVHKMGGQWFSYQSLGQCNGSALA
ncbi:hypothetical protein QIG89_28115, partial [Klebsiella pneumoniae]|nr:hypothetical protein [Klebsiella pneumoniae]